MRKPSSQILISVKISVSHSMITFDMVLVVSLSFRLMKVGKLWKIFINDVFYKSNFNLNKFLVPPFS